ncbi:MAG: histidine phosphatase family protein [Chloroflexi bacterium]|nr:MAG: histidine phosphatase family protein [Chloroflexota bacterium]
MQLYFIRHGQSENNASWAKHQSSDAPRVPDPRLTDAGHQQAHHVGRYLAINKDSQPDLTSHDRHNRSGFHLTHLYTSLMTRAINTADYISQACDLPMITWEETHEWGGIYEKNKETGERIGLPGPKRAFFEEYFPRLQLPEALGDEGWWNRPYEPFEAMPKRAKLVAAELLARHGGTNDRVALVSHGGFGFGLLKALIDFKSPNNASGKAMNVWFSMNNTSISRVDFGPDYLAIVYLNRVDHLPTALIT